MDDQTRIMLRGAYEYLKGQQEEIQQLQIVTLALRKTLRDLGPNVEALYGKYYLAEMQGPGKRAGDATIEALSQLIRQLSVSSEPMN